MGGMFVTRVYNTHCLDLDYSALIYKAFFFVLSQFLGVRVWTICFIKDTMDYQFLLANSNLF